LESIRNALISLETAIAPFATLSDWPTLLGFAGDGGSVIAGVLENAGKLVGLPFVGALAAAFLSAAFTTLWFLGQTVHSILDEIRDLKEEVDHAEIPGNHWDSRRFTDFMNSARGQMSHLMIGYVIGVGVGTLATLVMAAFGNPFTQVATVATLGVALGSLTGLLIGHHITDQLDEFDRAVRAAGGA
jgi:hypothetical protein